MNVLVDTSIWSLALRRQHHDLSSQEASLKQELSLLIEENRVQLIGPVRQELLSGIRRFEQFLRIREQLRPFQDVALDAEDFEEAARMHNECRSAGITGSNVDFLICAVAIRQEWQVFTMDKDFQLYARHIPLVLFAPRKYRP